jgi:fibronectin type 3 domain-containing protein
MAPALPAAPANLAATAGDTQVALSWNVGSGASACNVKRSVTSGGPYALVASTTGTNYTDTAVTNGTTYYYVVSAANITGESAASNEVTATPFASPIILTIVSATNGQFTLQFQAVNGRTYVVQTSTDLATWSPIYTNQAIGSPFLFTDTNAVDQARFYRVKQ